MLRNQICNFSRVIGSLDSGALKSGDDLISHKELVSGELDFPRLFAGPAMSCKSQINARYVARPLALKQKAYRCTHRTVLGKHSSTQIKHRHQVFGDLMALLAFSMVKATRHTAFDHISNQPGISDSNRPVGISDERLDGATVSESSQKNIINHHTMQSPSRVAGPDGGPIRNVDAYWGTGVRSRTSRSRNVVGVLSYRGWSVGSVCYCSLLASSRRASRSLES